MKTIRSTRLQSLLQRGLIISMISLPCFLAATVQAQSNLAQGKSVATSSHVDVYAAGNTNDGNQASYWESQYNAFPQSLTVDLGSPYNLNRVVLKLPSNWESRTQNISIVGSLNGSSYSPLVNSTDYTFNPDSDNNVTINLPDSNARYVRVNVASNTGWPAAQISEVEVYGDNETSLRDAFAQMKATSYDSMSGVQSEETADNGGGSNIGWINDGDWVAFNNIDFGSGATTVSARVASNTAGGTIELRLSSVSGSLIGTLPVTSTGGWQNWVTETGNVSVDGIHDLYLVFKGSAAGGLFNVNWLQFSSDNSSDLPAVPQNLSSTGNTTSSVSLSWNAANGADGYEILRDGNLITTTTGTTFTDTGLSASTTYSYTVRAFNSAGNSSASSSVSVLTDSENENPQAVKVSAGKDVTASTSVGFLPATNAVDNDHATYWESSANAFPQTLTVDLGSTHRVSRVVLKLPNDPAWATRTQNVSVSGSSDGTGFNTLVASAAYVFNPASANTVTINFAETATRFVRLNITGNTGWSGAQLSEFEVYGYADPVPPATPQNLRTSGASASSIFLAWDTASGASGYRILRGNTVVGEVTTTTFEDTGLAPITEHTYTVVAHNQYGDSAESNQVTATTLEEGSGGGDDDWEPNGTHGAQVPYTRYDTEDANFGGGAQLKTAPTFDQSLTAAEASGQAYIALPSSGSYVEWTVKPNEGGAGVTMRFTMPDSANGMGLSGALDVFVNGERAQTVPLTSYYNYQYFNPGSGHPADTPAAGDPLFRFDEVHWILSTPLQAGDAIRMVKASGDNLEYGVDFLEIEPVPAALARPGNSVSVTDFGAIANDGNDDLEAFNEAVTAAVANNQALYIPEGTFHLSSMWVIGSVANKIDDITIRGAGMWHTNIQFTNPNVAGGGISFRVAGQLDFGHVYMNSMLRSRYHEGAIYKGFMDNFGENSKVHNVWVEHFECGFWVGDYAHTPAIIADGLIIEHSRIRNNLADGVNFAQGTSNSTVRNSSIRNNGDDGLAVWTSNVNGAPAGVNNLFTYNTIEFNWRAAAIAFFGGSGHKATYNMIVDGVGSSGFRMNTVFPGYHFQNNTGIEFSNSTIIRGGTSLDTWGGERGAIDLEASSDPIRNVTISDIDIFDTQRSAIQMGYGGGFENVVFNNININGTGLDGITTSRFSGPHLGAAIYTYTNNGTATFNGLTTSNIANPNTNFVQNGFNLIIND
jgi:chitodextrinase